MDNDFTIIGKIVVDSSGAMSIQSVENNIKNIKTSSEGAAGGVSFLGGAMMVAFGGFILDSIGKIVGMVKDLGLSVLEAGAESQDVQAQLEQVLKSTGGVAGMTLDQLNALAQKTAETTRYNDEMAASAETVLLQYTKIGKETFPQALKLATDFATRMKIDLPAAAQTVGKALGDPEQGIGRLNTQLRLFSDVEQKAIEKMAAAGDIAGAQAKIMDRLKEKVGGAAEAAGKTAAGQWQILTNKIEEFKEKIGVALLPVLAHLLEALMPYIDKYLPMFADWFIKHVVPAISKAVDWVISLIDWLGKGGSPITAMGNFIKRAFGEDAYKAFIAVVGAFMDLKRAFDEHKPAIQKAINDIKGYIGDLLKIIGPDAKTAIAGMIQTFAIALRELAKFWHEHGDEIIAVISFIFKTIITIVALMFDLWSAKQRIFNDIWKGDWQDVTKVIYSTIDNALRMILGLFGINLDALHTMAFRLGQALAQPFKDVFSQLNSLVGQFFNIGQNIISSILQGINSAGYQVSQTLTNIVNSAIAAIKATLGIASPSKVGINLGKAIPEGLAEGIRNAAQLPTIAISRMLPPMANAMAQVAHTTDSHNSQTNNYYFGAPTYPGGGQTPGGALSQSFRKP